MPQYPPTEIITGNAIPSTRRIYEGLELVECWGDNAIQDLKYEVNLLRVGNWIISE